MMNPLAAHSVPARQRTCKLKPASLTTGAGHMVPQFKPSQAAAFMRRWLFGHDIDQPEPVPEESTWRSERRDSVTGAGAAEVLSMA